MRHPGEDVRSRPGRKSLLLLAAAIACIGLAVLGYSAARSAEVVAKGELFAYSHGTIYKVRFFDRWDAYVEPDVRPSLDIVNTYVLVVVSTVALSTLALLRLLRIPRSRETTAFLALMGIGALYLGADELIGIHETIGHNMRFLADIPGNKQPDGAIVALYLILAGTYLWVFRRRLLSSRLTMRLIALAVVFGALAVGADVIDAPGEEILEPLCSFSLGAAFIALIGKELLDALAEHGVVEPNGLARVSVRSRERA